MRTRLLPEMGPSAEEAFDDLWDVVVKSDDKRAVAIRVLEIGVRSMLKEPFHHWAVRLANSRRQRRAEARINVVDVAPSSQTLSQ